MNINDWAGVAVSVTTLIGALAMGVRHLVKHYLAELKPNSGSSIKDKVNDIDAKVNNLELRIDEIYALLLKRKAR
jgi:CRISPR/Cas system-associated protein Cas5 (RAMP superfamily)